MPEEQTEARDVVLDFVISNIESLETWKKEPGTPPTIEDVAALLRDDVPRGPADVTSFHDFYTLSIAFEHVWEEKFGNEIGQLGQELYGYIVSEKNSQPESGTRHLFSIDLVQYPLNFVSDLNAETVSDELRQLFRQHGEILAPQPRVEVEQYGRSWTVLSDDQSYLIQVEGGTLGVYGVLIYGLADVERLLAEARSVLDQRVALAGVPAAVKEWLPGITAEMWGALGIEGRRQVLEYMVAAQVSKETYTFTLDDLVGETGMLELYTALQDRISHYGESHTEAETTEYRKRIMGIYNAIETALEDLEAEGGDVNKQKALELIETYLGEIDEIPEGDTVPLIAKVAQALKEPHAFKVYAVDSVNFGVLLNYRQEWDPQTYQVGELVNTIPLAPKEMRKYTKKQIHKESRKRKEVNNALSIRRGDTSLTGRSETEIVNRANEKTAFNASANASGSIGVVSFGGSTSLDVDSAKESARTKKNFREAVTKSAQELKNEQKLEVELTTSSELEDTMTGEISNPNEEIVVTYLFYELQRRYKVYEYLHDATPVILVANDVPNPDEIDEAWLLRYEWILRRVILDDEFLVAFNLLKRARSGKNIEIDTLRTHVEHQLRAFQDTKIELETYTKSRAATERELRAAVERYAEAVSAEQSTIEEMGSEIGKFLSPGGIFGSVHDFFFGSPGPEPVAPAETAEAAQARQEAVEEALARIDRSITDTRTRLQGISTALDQAIDKYMTAVRTRLDGELALMKLRVHVKDNILYYMQAIWDHEPPDQRFFRLCDIRVPMLRSPQAELNLLKELEGSSYLFNSILVGISQMVVDQHFVTLKEIADLDNLLGYKGNYMIFPLIAEHSLTSYMMQDYLDEHGRIRDPDESVQTVLQGQPSASIWAQFEAKVARERIEPRVEELRQQLDSQEIDEREYAEKASEVRREFDTQVQAFRQGVLKDEQSDIIVVPSDLLFIAALPGTHPVLEDFKLKHRGIDVLKAAAELEEQQVELIRRKARLLGKRLQDPEIDKRVVITGKSSPVSASEVGVGEVVGEVEDAGAAGPESDVDV